MRKIKEGDYVKILPGAFCHPSQVGEVYRVDHLDTGYDGFTVELPEGNHDVSWFRETEVGLVEPVAETVPETVPEAEPKYDRYFFTNGSFLDVEEVPLNEKFGNAILRPDRWNEKQAAIINFDQVCYIYEDV
jgi:hypothetical protein